MADPAMPVTPRKVGGLEAAVNRRRFAKKDTLVADLTPNDIINEGGDTNTVSKWRRTLSNTPYPDAVLDQIPAPRGRGSAQRTPISPMPTRDEIAERVNSFERSYHKAKSTAMPFTWLIQQDQADLSFLEDPEVAEMVLTEMYSNAEFRANEDKYNRQIAARTDEILKGRENQQNFFNNIYQIPILGPAAVNIAGLAGMNDIVGDPNARTQAELELLGHVAPVVVGTTWWDDFLKVAFPEGEVQGILNEVAEWVTIAATMSVATTSFAMKGLSGGRVDPIRFMEQAWRENVESRRAEYVEVLSQPEQDKIKQARAQYADAWYENMQAEGWADEFVTMGIGGGPATARALMESAANIMFDEDPELQNQVMTALEDEQVDLLEALDKEGHEISGQTSALMGWYAHNVPNRLATYFTVLFSQEDLTEFFTSDRWLALHEEAVQADFQPSKVLGIDGTTQGIFFDVGMGGLFDPLNVVLGPAGRALGINTVAQAARVARAPATRSVLRNTAKTIRSYFRDDAASVALLEGFDEFGMFDEFVANAVGVEQVFSNRGWLNHRNARITKEVPVETILRSLPDEVVTEGRRQAAAVRGAGAVDESVLLLNEPAVLQYSRVTGGVTMGADDVARLILSQEVAGSPSVAFPTYGRVIDNVPDDVVRVMDDVTANPNDYFYHGRSTSRNRPGSDEFTGGGLETSLTSATAYGDQMLVFKRDDVLRALPDWARKKVEAGSRIERLWLSSDPKLPATLARGHYVVNSMPTPVTRWLGDDFARHQTPTPTRTLDTPMGRLPDDADFSLPDLLDESYLYPELNGIMPRLEAMAERLYARGGGMSLPQRTATSRIFANDVRASFRERKTIGPWALRYWTRQNVGTWLRTHGFGWEADIRQNIMRMFGHDVPTANLWLRRLRESLRPGADQADFLALRIELKNATDELRFLDDNATGILGDDPVQVLGEPIREIRGPSLADETFPDDPSIAAQAEARGLAPDEFAEPPGPTMADETFPDDPSIAAQAEARGLAPDEFVPDEIDEALVRRIEDETSAFEADAFSADLIARRNAAKAKVARLEAESARLQIAAQKTRGAAAQRVINDMWADFNRRYIATNPFWKKHVGADGMVPWEVITGGTRRTSTRSGLTVPKAVDEGTSANSIMSQLMDDLGDPGVMVPLAPLDMIAASELGGAKWVQWEQLRFAENVKNMGNFLDRIWKMDKVFRVSTSMTVNFDELIRVFHRYGAPAVMQWMEDRVMFTSARAKAVIGDRAPAHGLSDSVSGTRAIFHNKRWNARMQRLNEYPEFYKHVERQYYEMFEDSWDDIAPGQAEWLPAMDQWTSNLLHQDGFRAYLRGREEFSKWWNSEEGSTVRNRSTFDWGDGRTRLATESEAWGGFDFLMNRVFLGKVRGGRTEAVRKAFIEGADRIAAGEQAVSIPQSILRELDIPVRGVRNLAPSATSAGRLSNKFFDNLFMQPTNYRRGFISELARKYETRRLYELYNSQGIQIIPDWKINSILPEYNVRNTAAFGLPEAIEQMLFDRNVVTQGTIARMAERKAMAEMEHIMYTWHMTSRAGRSPALRATFPFGKPYYDMWAHYGREMMTRPALRGFINNTNFGNLANKALDRFPINPKPPALVSRIASTDFDADKQGMNFSPLLFFPTEGENSMMSVLPGVGMLPMWMMDFIVSNVHDPFEEPVEYQALVESISNWIPSFGFQQTGLAGRALGGGALATGWKAVTDQLMMGSNRSFHEALSIFGDIQNEIQTNRAVKAILADPEEWAVLMGAREAELPALFEALIGEAYGTGAGSHFKDITSRWFVPVDFDFDTTDDDVQDVWLTAAEKFPALAPRNFTRNADDDVLKEDADDIRRAFFDLPKNERDMMLVQYPQLAVNMVGGWEWTDKAEDEFPTEANTPYRTIGGQEGLARHQSLIRNDYIRPIAAPALMARILGTVFEARVNLAESLYKDQAEQVNEYMWENVIPPAGKNFFESLVTDGIVDASNGREVWQNFSRYEDDIVEAYGPTSLPEAMTAWGTSWRGLEEDGFSQRFREITLGEEWSEITPEILERAAVLGIEMEHGMTGEQFVAQIHDLIRDNVAGSALPSFVKDEFDSYRDARNAPANAARLTLQQLTAGENGDPVFKEAVNDFLNYEARTGTLRNENGLVDPERAQNVVEQYKQLMNSSPELNFSWEDKWHDAFESDYGPLDYEYPQPPTLNPDDFRNTYRPYIWDVQDGDTLVVSNEPSAPWLDLPGNRFDILSGGTPKKHSVRLLGIYAPEMSTEDGKLWLDRLTDAIMEAKRNGTPIYLVRDSDTTGNRNVDFFGRELAWLFIGDEPYYHPETIVPGS